MAFAVSGLHLESVTATADPDVPGNAIPTALWQGVVMATGASDLITQAMWDTQYAAVQDAVAAEFDDNTGTPETDPVVLP